MTRTDRDAVAPELGLSTFGRLALATAPLALLAVMFASSCDDGSTTPVDCDTGEEEDTDIDWSLDNEYFGTTGSDEIYAGNGSDTISGNAGDDYIYGGFGPDTLNGDDGDDEIDGGVGADTVNGGNGFDRLYGGNGPDTLIGEIGEDLLVGGRGNDNLRGGADDDELYGNDGDDTLFGGPGADLMDGGRDNDELLAGDDDDTLYGGPGDDVLTGGLGSDTMYGGEGADEFVLDLECGARDRIFDFIGNDDTLVLPVDVFIGDVRFEANFDNTGVLVISNKPTPDCELAFLDGVSPTEAQGAVAEQ